MLRLCKTAVLKAWLVSIGLVLLCSYSFAKDLEMAALPIFGSSSETGFIYGGYFTVFFPSEDPEQQPSSIGLTGVFTEKNQSRLAWNSNSYFRFQESLYRLETQVASGFRPRKLYAKGGDSDEDFDEYELQSLDVQVLISKEIFKHVFVGLESVVQNSDISIEEGPVNTEGLQGLDGGLSVGNGVAFTYDSRDNLNAPSSGRFMRYSLLVFDTAFLSDFSYTVQELDLRHYVPLSSSDTLATATYLRLSNGNVPFRNLSSPDGYTRLRGVVNRRYYDNHLLGGQIEYRKRLNERLGVSVFGDFFEVFNSETSLQIQSIKSSYGVGFRYALNKEEKFNLRLDLAWLDEEMGMVIGVREAF